MTTVLCAQPCRITSSLVVLRPRGYRPAVRVLVAINRREIDGGYSVVIVPVRHVSR